MNLSPLQIFALIWILVVVAVTAANNSTREPKPDTELMTHCAMVKLWHNTDQEFGWPDYNGRAARGDCDTP
jgi:hypothetical protein